MKTLKKLLFFISGICLLIGCSKSDQLSGDNLLGHSFKNGQNEPIADLRYSPGTVYDLKGLALYKTWTVIDGTIIQDNKLDCTGTIEFLDGRNFRFSFQENRPGGNGMLYYGKISSSGVLTFQFPAPLMPGTEFYITDVIKSHGCVIKIWGPGINQGTLFFNGRFDGEQFTAEAKFMALVDESCPDLFNPTYKGQVHWIFGYDLDVVKN